jgi:glycosyltransferase involved in cell wall biosynthesis
MVRGTLFPIELKKKCEDKITSISVCLLTTAHRSDDVRIFSRECRSLLELSSLKVTLAAPGRDPGIKGLSFLGLGNRPSSRFKRIFYSQYKAIQTLVKVKADIWHIHDPELLLFAICLILLRKKVVWDSHEDYFQQFAVDSEYRSYVPKIIRRLLSKIILGLLKVIDSQASGIIAATEVIQRKYLNANCVVVGNEARSEDFENLQPNFENQTVLFIGSMNESHCFPEVVKAVSRIVELNLVIAGEGNKDLLTWSKQLLGDRVTFVGWANREMIFDLISKSTIGMVTYQNLPTYNESRPTKLFEFLMSGLPIVASPIKPNVFFLQESLGGITSSGFKSSDFEKTLRQAISSKDSWLEMSENGKAWARANASWEASEKNLLALYRKLIGEVD